MSLGTNVNMYTRTILPLTEGCFPGHRTFNIKLYAGKKVETHLMNHE